MDDIKVKFREWNCVLNVSAYRDNNRVALQLIDEEDGDMVAMATVNLPNENLSLNEVCIKDYSENDGMVQALVKAGVINYPKRWASSGFVNVPICELLII